MILAAPSEKRSFWESFTPEEDSGDEPGLPGMKGGFPLSHLRENEKRGRGEAFDGGRPGHEVADIFRAYGAEFRATHALSREEGRVMYDIEHCRTQVMGSHWDVCDMCGHAERSYCSCHNRHCPKCQGAARRIWVKERLESLLPVPYYHVVFTLPDEELHPLYLYNRKILYDLLFDSAAETLMTFGRDPRWLGAEMGFFGVLHTWGQTLSLHPHVHFVVPAGGVDEWGDWVAGKHHETFLFPVKALSKRMRKLFTEGLDEAYPRALSPFPRLEGLHLAAGFCEVS